MRNNETRTNLRNWIREFIDSHLIRSFESVMTIEKILLEFDSEMTNLLPALKRISAAFGYVSQEDAGKTAKYFGVPKSKVYETASFYDLLSTKPQPDLVIQVCSGTNCTVNDSMKVIREIENYFKIKAGDEFNPKVKLEIISCLGQCGEGPIVVVNGKNYQGVTASGVHRILEEHL
jgi:NADH-quinone oxidoreductase subunit E